jgi:hypothetical protein
VTESAAPLQVIEETPAYWRDVLDYPPFNVGDARMFQGLQDLLARRLSGESRFTPHALRCLVRRTPSAN